MQINDIYEIYERFKQRWTTLYIHYEKKVQVVIFNNSSNAN
jgi:hypothetical protein